MHINPDTMKKAMATLKVAGLLARRAFLVFLIWLIVVHMVSPSLDFSPDNKPEPYQSASAPTWGAIEAVNGVKWPAMQSTILTHDGRTLDVELIGPSNVMLAHLPVNILITGTVQPEWILSKMVLGSQDSVATIVYRSPRLARMNAENWPAPNQLNNINSLSGLYEAVITNPFTKYYNIHQGLHEAPGDIYDIVQWIKAKTNLDTKRINLIGMGSGALIAAAAADALNAQGQAVNSIVLSYPPGNLRAAFRDNLINLPSWSRDFIARALTPLYYRIELSSHLPLINADTKKLVIIPENSFDLATYAAEPVIAMAGQNTTVVRLDAQYNGYFHNSVTVATRNIIEAWLKKVGAVDSASPH